MVMRVCDLNRSKLPLKYHYNFFEKAFTVCMIFPNVIYFLASLFIESF